MKDPLTMTKAELLTYARGLNGMILSLQEENRRLERLVSVLRAAYEPRIGERAPVMVVMTDQRTVMGEIKELIQSKA